MWAPSLSIISKLAPWSLTPHPSSQLPFNIHPRFIYTHTEIAVGGSFILSYFHIFIQSGKC